MWQATETRGTGDAGPGGIPKDSQVWPIIEVAARIHYRGGIVHSSPHTATVVSSRPQGVPQCDARMISHTLHRLHSLVLNVHMRRQSVACQPSTSVEFQSQVLAEVHYGKRTEVVEFMYCYLYII